MKKTIIILFSAMILAGWFLVSLPTTAAAGLDVDFETTPLFQDGDIKPCHIVTRWIQVTNHSGQTQPVYIEAVNFIEPIQSDDLARALSIEIKASGDNLYGPVALSDFYQNGETFLSDLADGATKQYDITITFPCEKQNEWQGKTTGFDLVIGFVGEGDGDGDGDEGSGSVCGNNVIESPEQCDDGNVASGDGCSSACQLEQIAPFCGDGVKNGEEQCDGTSGVPEGYHCADACRLEPNSGRGGGTPLDQPLDSGPIFNPLTGGGGPLAFAPTPSGNPPGEVLGTSTQSFLPATGFKSKELVLILMFILSLIGLRIVLNKYNLRQKNGSE